MCRILFFVCVRHNTIYICFVFLILKDNLHETTHSSNSHVLQKNKETRKIQLFKIALVTERHLHVIRLQRCIRRYLSMKRAQEQIASVITIQVSFYQTI